MGWTIHNIPNGVSVLDIPCKLEIFPNCTYYIFASEAEAEEYEQLMLSISPSAKMCCYGGYYNSWRIAK